MSTPTSLSAAASLPEPSSLGDALQKNHLCPIARTTSLIADAWTPLILRELMVGHHRFAEIRDSLDISKAVLTQRLRTLEENSIITRVEYQAHPPRAEYHLTEKGWALWDVLLAMWGFGDQWLFRDGAGLELIHSASQMPVAPVVVDRSTGEAIDIRNTRLRVRQR